MEPDPHPEAREARECRLRALAEAYAVAYEVSPARIAASSGLRTVGYDVSLIGHHRKVEGLVKPGCTRCQAIWIDLGALANAAIPRPEWRTRICVRPFDHSLHYSTPGENGEVELVIEVRHRSDYQQALDDCEDTCLARLLANLRSLGINPRAVGCRLKR